MAPTETRYGLVGRADSPRALDQLVRAKGRSILQPVAVFVETVEQAWQLGLRNSIAETLAKNFLPGPLTLVLRAQVDWPPPLVNEQKIGLRLTDAPVIIKVLRDIGVALTATSANRSGAAAVATIDEIMAQLGADVDMYLDVGPLDRAVSTVVDTTVTPPAILREGAIGRARIFEICERESN